MSQQYVATLDVGTTGVRSLIIRKDGKVVGRSYRSLGFLYPSDGCVEQSPSDLWEKTQIVLKEAFENSQLNSPSLLSAMGISTQRSSFILWEKETGESLTNFFCWQDTRTAKDCDIWNNGYIIQGLNVICKLLHFVSRSERFLSGSKFAFTPMQSTMRLKWALANIPNIRERLLNGSVLFGTVDSWIVWKLTGGKVHATDLSNFSSTGLYDPFSGGYIPVFFALDIPAQIFPERRPTSGDFGTTYPSLFDGVSIPIRSLCGDQQASLFGQCCFDEGDVKITLGTGAFVSINTGNTPRASTRGTYPVVAWQIGKNITYMMEGNSGSCGSFLEWVIKTFKIVESVRETEDLAKSVEDNHGAYFVPAFSGLGAPYNDAHATATLIGLRPSTSGAHIIRAALESIGYRCKDIYDIIESSFQSKELEHIYVDGGVCQNNFVSQFCSDMIGLPIVRPSNIEMSSLGVAYLAGLSVGVWSSLNELRELRSNDRVFEPNLSLSEIRKNYCGWCLSASRSLNWDPNSLDDGSDDFPTLTNLTKQS